MPSECVGTRSLILPPLNLLSKASRSLFWMASAWQKTGFLSNDQHSFRIKQSSHKDEREPMTTRKALLMLGTAALAGLAIQKARRADGADRGKADTLVRGVARNWRRQRY